MGDFFVQVHVFTICTNLFSLILSNIYFYALATILQCILMLDFFDLGLGIRI